MMTFSARLSDAGKAWQASRVWSILMQCLTEFRHAAACSQNILLYVRQRTEREVCEVENGPSKPIADGASGLIWRDEVP